jgi:putative nucleotidyltransferase with HDIG domain
MSLTPSIGDQEQLAETLRRRGSRITGRERRSEIVVGCGFVIAAAGLICIQPPHAFNLAPAVLCLVVLVVATRVRFDTSLGFTTATQLGFVPLLFAMPVTLVPIAVVFALAMARLPDVLAGQVQPSRLLLTVGNSWFAIGPVAVFVLADTQPGNAGPVLLIIALAAQFSVDFAASTLRFWLGRGAGLSEQLRETWVYGIDAALSAIALVVAEAVYATPVAALAPLPLLGLLALFARERRERMEGLLELNHAYRGTALVLGDMLGADDTYTGEHTQGVVVLAVQLAAQLGLGAERRRNVEFGALLHDVGKIAIPKEIIHKPGKLDPDEWGIIKTHTLEGQKMLNRVGGFMSEVGLIIRSHHERWDGSGYPDGMAGETIPVESRIISCCDSWNAMRTDRPYRKALTHDAALAELKANAGGQFDPSIVAAFETLIEPAGQPTHVPAKAAQPRSAINHQATSAAGTTASG